MNCLYENIHDGDFQNLDIAAKYQEELERQDFYLIDTKMGNRSQLVWDYQQSVQIQVIQVLELNNPIIRLVCKADVICAKCPHNHCGECVSGQKVNNYMTRSV